MLGWPGTVMLKGDPTKAVVRHGDTVLGTHKLFAAVHAEARDTFGEQPVDARTRALIAEIRSTAARHSEKLQITTPPSEQG